MTSHKRRTTSKSGSSEKSTKTAPSRPNKPLSAGATASFDQVFGAPEPKDPEKQRLEALLFEAQQRLSRLRMTPVPHLALYRQRHLAKLSRETAHIRNLEEAIRMHTASTRQTGSAD